MSSQSATSQKASINPLERGAEELLTQPSEGYWAGIWKQVRARPTAVMAIVVLIFLALIAITAPLLTNHRPFISFTPSEGEDGSITSQVAFPLFRALSTVDWTLLSGLVSVLWLIAWRRSLLRRDGRSNPIVLGLFALFSVTPVVWGLVEVPWDREAAMPGGIWWTLFGLVGAVGAVVLVLGLSIVAVGRKDEFGRDLTGPALRRLFVGSLALVIAGSSFGTLARPKLDRTDYYNKYKLNAEEGAWAFFPPLPHDYLGSEPYAITRRPLEPKLRVMPSGGSKAAAGIQWDDQSIDKDETLSKFYSGTLAMDTPLADLNDLDDKGKPIEAKGVTLHERGSTDLIIITHDLSTTRVRLRGSKTLGDVVDKLNEQAMNRRTQEVKYVASLNPVSGIEFDDRTTARPVHLMGTEGSGADVASRLIMATRVALSIGFVSTGIAALIGVTFGAILGYFGGWVDYIGMRIIEIFMAIPRLFLLLTIIAFLPPKWGPYMLYAMMVVIGLTSWMPSARFIRAEFFRLRETDYVQAAKACGLPLRSILFKHMLPNGVTPVLVSASFGVAAAIFVETGLSFLGFGIKPPNPSWGQMLNEAIDPSTGVFRWWLAIFPGIMIFLTVFAFNLIGDALRDAIDPRLKKASAI